jgi:integrase
MRKSELLGLQWKDIDAATLRIERQLLNYAEDPATGKHNLETSLPKRGKTRSVELSAGTVDLLREHKRQQAETKLKNRLHYMDYGLVFALDWEHKSSKHSVLGGPLPKLKINWHLAKLCDEAKVKKINVHGLRHTCATLLISAGAPANVVQKRLGHANVEMTLSIYAHVLPSMQQDAARQMGAMLHG